MDRHVIPLWLIILDSEPTVLVFLLNAACFTEKQQISISVFGFGFGLTRPELEPTIYHVRGEHVNN